MDEVRDALGEFTPFQFDGNFRLKDRHAVLDSQERARADARADSRAKARAAENKALAEARADTTDQALADACVEIKFRTPHA